MGMTSQPVIREMTPDDIPIVAAWMANVPLWQRYGVIVEKATANFEAGLARRDWLLVVDTDVQACGFAWIVPQGAFGRSPYLKQIGVHLDYANAGLGGLLLNEAERRAKAVADDLFLLTSNFNTAAQRFYTRHGYEQIGAIPDYVINGLTELIFRKRLR
jgi:ribosomal protein S18 acetylase RimI-like enzyme